MSRVLGLALLLGLLAASAAILRADPDEGDEARTSDLRVVVTDAFAEPLPGIRVTVSPHVPSAAEPRHEPDLLAMLYVAPVDVPPTTVREAVTGEDGSCRFAGIPPSVGHVVVAHAREPDVDARAVLTAGAAGPTTHRLAIQRGEMLRGRVVDAQGKGQRAWVTATAYSNVGWPYGTRSGTGRHVVRRHATDEDGRFAFPAPVGFTTHLQALVPGHRIWSGVVASGADEVIIPVGFEDGARAFGTVRDIEGSPVPEARVVVHMAAGDWPYDRPYLHALTRTDASGRWEVAGLPRSRVLQLVAGRDGYAVRQVRLSVPLGRADFTPIDVVLYRPRTLTGRVLDVDSQPVVGAEVYEAGGLQYIPFALVPKPPGARTDADGRYRLVAFTATTPVVSAKPPGWDRFVTSNPRARWGGRAGVEAGTDIDVVLQAVGSVYGTVRSVEGRRLRGVEIRVGNPMEVRTGGGMRTVSKADGSYRLDGLYIGVDMLVRSRSPGRWSPEESIRIEKGGQASQVDFVLQPAGRLEGRARDASGRGLAYVTVMATPAGDSSKEASVDRIRWVRADHAGWFRFDELPPGRPVRVRLAYEDLEQGVEATPSAAESAWIELIRPKGHDLSGRVVDPEGRGVPLVTVALVQDGVKAELRTDARGRFGFTRLPAPAHPAGYKLRLRWTTLETPLPPGTTDAVLRFEEAPARFIEGLVLLPDGRPVPWAQARLESAPANWHAVRAGWFRIYVARETEDLAVAVRDPRDAMGGSLSLRRAVYGGPVPEAPLEFRLTPGLHVGGRLVDGQGLPVADRELHYIPDDAAWWEVHTPYVAQTRNDGTFVIDGLRPGTGTLTLKADPLFWPQPGRPCRAGTDDLEIRTRRIVGVRGRITDAEGTPLEGAQVILTVLEDEDEKLKGANSKRAKSDAEGRFEIPRIPSGARVQLRVPRLQQSSDTYFGTVVECVAARDASQEIVLVRTETVSGTVLDETGAPVVGARVRAEILRPADRDQANAARLDARTDAEGRFLVGPLPPDALVDVVLPPLERGGALHLGARVDGVRAGTRDLVVHVRRAAVLKGVLMGPEEQSIPGARIQLEPWFVEDHAKARRHLRAGDKDVAFLVEGLYPGRYLLTVTLETPDFVVPKPFPVDVPCADLVIQLRRAHPIRGRVLGAAQRAQIRFVTDDVGEGAVRHRRRRVADDGTFVVANDTDVPGTLVAETRDGRFAVLADVRPSEGPFELTLQRGVRIAGHIEGLPPRLGERARIGVRIRLGRLVYETRLDRADAFRFPDVLPAGRYEVEIVSTRLKGRIVAPDVIVGGDEEVVLRYEAPTD